MTVEVMIWVLVGYPEKREVPSCVVVVSFIF